MKVVKLLVLLVMIGLVWSGIWYFHRLIHTTSTAARQPRASMTGQEPPAREQGPSERSPTLAAFEETAGVPAAEQSAIRDAPAHGTPRIPPEEGKRAAAASSPPVAQGEKGVGKEEEKLPGKIQSAPEDDEAASPAPLRITTTELPPAVTGMTYSVPLFAEGGTMPYTWEIGQGILPDGLSLDPINGIIAGTPQSSGEHSISLALTDAQGIKATASSVLAVIEEEGFLIPRPAGVRSGGGSETGAAQPTEPIQPPQEDDSEEEIAPLYIVTGSLPDSEIDRVYSVKIDVEGGEPPYVWSISEGDLPDGFVLETDTGVIAGIAREVEQAVFRVRATDSGGRSDVAGYTINVRGEELVITTAGLEAGTVGSLYSHALEAAGGLIPYRWGIAAGSLPQGVMLGGESGLISGTPEEPISTWLTISVSDAQGSHAYADLELIIGSPALIIVTDSLPDARIDEEYRVTVTAEGGLSPYAWAVTNGELPAGLSLDGILGTISGIPSGEPGPSRITLSVTDEEGAADEKEFTITVEQKSPLSIEDLTATPSDRKVGLSWSIPEDEAFSHAVIVRNIAAYPASVDDGSVIYSGTDTAFLDGAASNGTTYYYTAFAYDREEKIGTITEGSTAAVTPMAVTLTGAADPFADAVASFRPLAANGFGAANLPAAVLGPPKGGGQVTGSLDVVSLHAKANDDNGASAPYGGSITLRFDDNIIVNGDGPDFIVFENVFFVGGDPEYRWMEPSIVAVSQNGQQFFTFPFDFSPRYKGDELNLYHPYCYSRGFAGINPVYSYGNSPDPRNPSVAGGDPFDLAELNLGWVRYVRITAIGDNWLTDVNGDRVRHISDMGACSGGGSSGFDLDAVCAINY